MPLTTGTNQVTQGSGRVASTFLISREEKELPGELTFSPPRAHPGPHEDLLMLAG